MELQLLNKTKRVREAIWTCERWGHVQQAAYSTYNDSLTQVCFTCKAVRTNMPDWEEELEEEEWEVVEEEEFEVEEAGANIENSAVKAMDVARFFIMLGDDNDDLLTNLRVQKLLYYAQGHWLACHDSPLFEENIYGWLNGPAVGSVWATLNEYDQNTIEFDGDDPVFSQEITEHLRKVYSTYSVYSETGLRNMTMNESPWKETSISTDSIITIDKMKKYFGSIWSI